MSSSSSELLYPTPDGGIGQLKQLCNLIITSGSQHDDKKVIENMKSTLQEFVEKCDKILNTSITEEDNQPGSLPAVGEPGLGSNNSTPSEEPQTPVPSTSTSSAQPQTPVPSTPTSSEQPHTPVDTIPSTRGRRRSIGRLRDVSPTGHQPNLGTQLINDPQTPGQSIRRSARIRESEEKKNEMNRLNENECKNESKLKYTRPKN